jgi:hypothetical protein
VRLAGVERAPLTARVPRELSVAHSLVPMALPPPSGLLALRRSPPAVPIALPQLVLVEARLQSGEAVLGESMALPQLVAPRVALTASLMAQQSPAPVMESLSPAKLWAEPIRSFLAGATVPERLIAAPR